MSQWFLNERTFNENSAFVCHRNYLYSADNTIDVVTGSDIDCTVDCACCVEPNQWFSNACTKGCIDGYVMKKCPLDCKTCTSNSGKMYCSICHEGYYNQADIFHRN